jgi:hypothetical protein
MTIAFANQGAGSILHYPGNIREGTAPPYVSIGCDWMRTINPFTNESLGTEEEIARCHPNGTLVPQREYNPLERDFCRNAALQFGNIDWYGPYLSNGYGIPLMFIGKAVFDRE